MLAVILSAGKILQSSPHTKVIYSIASVVNCYMKTVQVYNPGWSMLYDFMYYMVGLKGEKLLQYEKDLLRILLIGKSIDCDTERVG